MFRAPGERDKKKLPGRLFALAFLLLLTPAVFHGDHRAIAQPARQGGYIVDFPQSDSIGTLELVPTKSTPGMRRVTIQARGRVVIPAHCHVYVGLSFAGSKNTACLDRLNAEEVTRFGADKLDFSDDDMKHLARFKNIECLSLKQTLITDKSLPILESFKDMVILGLNSTALSGKNLLPLAKYKNLREFNLEGIQLKPGVFSAIASSPEMQKNLHNLGLSRTGLTDSEMIAVGRLSHLRHLTIDGNKALSDRCISQLANLKDLDFLNINDTAITEKSLPILLKLKKLNRIIVRETTFWKGGKKHGNTPGLVIEDITTTLDLDPDLFKPLH